MDQPPRPRGEGVLTWPMWRGIVFVGVIMAVGTLFVLDASLPAGFVDGHGDLRYAQTMAFTTLMLFQLFNVLNARSDERSAFVGLFTNRWLWAAIGGSVVLQLFVLYTPFLQRAFGTTGLSGRDWLFSVTVASSVLWLREASKAIARARAARAA
jgi:Ca2+-transporting ATPase